MDVATLRDLFRALTNEDRPWAIGQVARNFGHTGCLVERTDRYDEFADDAVTLCCSKCGWRYRFSGEDLEARVDALLGLGRTTAS